MFFKLPLGNNKIPLYLWIWAVSLFLFLFLCVAAHLKFQHGIALLVCSPPPTQLYLQLVGSI